jgi:hypothetical protein
MYALKIESTHTITAFDTWADLIDFIDVWDAAGFPIGEYEIDILEDGDAVRTNLMSGFDLIVESGTPLACDPSRETYWSM